MAASLLSVVAAPLGSEGAVCAPPPRLRLFLCPELDLPESARSGSRRLLLPLPAGLKLVADFEEYLRERFAGASAAAHSRCWHLSVGGFTLLPEEPLADVLRDGDEVDVRAASGAAERCIRRTSGQLEETPSKRRKLNIATTAIVAAPAVEAQSCQRSRSDRTQDTTAKRKHPLLAIAPAPAAARASLALAAPAALPAPAAMPAKAKAKAAAEDDSDDSSDEPAPKAKAKAGGKGESKGKEEEVENTVFVGGLPFSMEEATLRKDFEECGEITRLSMPLNGEGNARGIAFITYKTKEGVEKALKFDGDEYGGRRLKVNRAGDKPDKGKGKDGKGKGKDGKGKGDRDGKGKGDRDDSLTVFIGGLPFSVEEEMLKRDFAECGEIVSLRLPMNDEGRPKGIAFMQFKDEQGVEGALKFHETDYGGRSISVRRASEGKGKDGKGKDGKGKKGKKGKSKGDLSYEQIAARHGAMVEGTGTKQTFTESDSDDDAPSASAAASKPPRAQDQGASKPPQVAMQSTSAEGQASILVHPVLGALEVPEGMDRNTFINRKLKTLKVAVRRQVEHYFSEKNWKQDEYLRQIADEDGFVEISSVAEFERLQSLTTDVPLIAASLKDSALAEVSPCGTRVRRRG